MKANNVLKVMGIGVLLAVLVACVGAPAEVSSTIEETSGRKPDAVVNGTVTYGERLALSPGAKLVVDLRDVTYADAPAPLIARQTISDPGQVPISFKLEYNREDIDSRNTYGISADIIESDGRLAFTNDTRYEVITEGNPDNVDMQLVLVSPPPGLVEDGVDWRTWVEVPAQVIQANLMPNQQREHLRIDYYQSGLAKCVMPGNQSLKIENKIIFASITLMQPPPTAWGIPCDEELIETYTFEPIYAPLEPGETYHVIVNGTETTSFSIPRSALDFTYIADSPIESAEVVMTNSVPPQYMLRVVSGLPRGSSCTQFNGYEIRRSESEEIEVTITHHEVADPMASCADDYPVVETHIPLGADFEPVKEYTVRVNSETVTRMR